MCLILFAYKAHPQYPIIIAANRDEEYNRSAAPAQFWLDNPDILGGRDLEAMGTWFGITKTGRFAAITNYRDFLNIKENARSRGELVANYLNGTDNPMDYLNNIKEQRDCYNGFNLLLGDTAGCWCYSNTTNIIEEILPGIHGLSNHLLNTPWTKVVKGKAGLAGAIQEESFHQGEELFKLLADTERAKPEELPDTGIGPERESLLSSIFIKSPDYGTRASTILLIDSQGRVIFKERSFFPIEPISDVSYEFDIFSY